MSELDGPRGSIRIQHRSPHHGKGIQTQGSVVSGTFFPSTGHTNVARKVWQIVKISSKYQLSVFK